MLPIKNEVTENQKLQALEDEIVACAESVYDMRVGVFTASEFVIEAASALKRAELQAVNSGAITGSNETIRKAQLAEIITPENDILTDAQKRERKARFDYDSLQNDFEVLRYRLRIAELMHQ